MNGWRKQIFTKRILTILLTWRSLETSGIKTETGGHRRFYKQTEKCKTATDTDALLSATLKLTVWQWWKNWRVPGSEHLLSNFFLWTNLCKMEKSTSVMHNLKYSRIDRNPWNSVTIVFWFLVYMEHDLRSVKVCFQTRGSLFFLSCSCLQNWCYGGRPLLGRSALTRPRANIAQ